MIVNRFLNEGPIVFYRNDIASETATARTPVRNS